jgi:hypothetical protein
MFKDGDLRMLKWSPWHHMMKVVMQTNMKFARFGQIAQIVRESGELVFLTFDIVNAFGEASDWTDVFECVQFAVEFLRFAELKFVISHSELRGGGTMSTWQDGIAKRSLERLARAIERSGIGDEHWGVEGGSAESECEGISVRVLGNGRVVGLIGRMKEMGWEDLVKADRTLENRKPPLITSARFDLLQLGEMMG